MRYRTVDERRDPIAATRAAARYLQHAYEELGTWPLAVTSYNHGIAGVAKKARAYGTSDIVVLAEGFFKERPFGFASTNFYPEFLAALDVYDQHDLYFPGLRLDAPIEVRGFSVPRVMSAAQLSKDLGVSLDTLRSVNLALTEPVWDGKYPVPKGYQLKVPLEQSRAVDKVMNEVALAPEPTARPNPAYSSAIYRVKKGDTLAAIAKRYHLSIDELKSVNELGEGSLRIGQQLVIRREEEKPPANMSETYAVRSGDTLHAIAKQYGITVARLRADNNLSTTKLSIGQKLTISKSNKR